MKSHDREHDGMIISRGGSAGRDKLGEHTYIQTHGEGEGARARALAGLFGFLLHQRISTMARGRGKGRPRGQRRFSSPEEILAGTSAHQDFKQDEEAEGNEEQDKSDRDSEEKSEKRKGIQGIIEIENPNLAKPRTLLKAGQADLDKTVGLSRRERMEIEKHEAHERVMRLKEQGKTEQARKDLERLSVIRKQRAEAALKRKEEKAAKAKKKAETEK